MRSKERREGGQVDLFRSRLDQILDLDHALARLTYSIDWGFLERKFGAGHDDNPGRPPLPTRLMERAGRRNRGWTKRLRTMMSRCGPPGDRKPRIARSLLAVTASCE